MSALPSPVKPLMVSDGWLAGWLVENCRSRCVLHDEQWARGVGIASSLRKEGEGAGGGFECISVLSFSLVFYPNISGDHIILKS
jgi:hypothetical protein